MSNWTIIISLVCLIIGFILGKCYGEQQNELTHQHRMEELKELRQLDDMIRKLNE